LSNQQSDNFAFKPQGRGSKNSLQFNIDNVCELDPEKKIMWLQWKMCQKASRRILKIGKDGQCS
jgi:hypothetical protein